MVCLGGAAGTGARYLVALWIARGSGFPYATLLVNVTGSFLLALLMALSLTTHTVSADTRLILGTGVLGGFTTYSAFNYETLALLRAGTWGVALVNVAATLFGCLAAGALGLMAARAIGH
jgi:CrcB protein